MQGGISGRYLAVNRGKRSIALDLKAPVGRDTFTRMVERADVVVESFRPGVMHKLGIDYATLNARRTRSSVLMLDQRLRADRACTSTARATI